MTITRTPCVICDVDGTLVDSLPGIECSVNAAFRACGIIQAPVQLRSMIGPPIRSILAQAGDMTETGKLDELERAFRDNYDSEGWGNSPCFPGVAQSLEIMRLEGYRCFVLTNKPRHITIRILESNGIMKHFEAVVARDSRTPPFSTKAEMLESLLRSRKLVRPDCIFVGDTQEDADAACACSIKFAFASYGYGNTKTDAPVYHVLNSFNQIPQLLSPEFAHDR